MERARIIEVLEALATETVDGARKMESGASMLTTDGVTVSQIRDGIARARFHAEVFAEAARLLKTPAETP